MADGLVWFVISCIYSAISKPRAHNNTKERKKANPIPGHATLWLVCVILYFYPATCDPKGHGSGSAIA